MIDVKYERSKRSLKVTGHAGYAEHGKDIVCSAASALFNTAAAALSAMDAAKTDIRVDEQGAYLAYTGKSGGKAQVILDVICRGYMILQSEYPNNVKVEGWT